MKKLTKTLAGSARQNGICDEWFNRLSNLNDDQIDRMLTMYVKGVDFCMKNDWPDLDLIRSSFKGRMEHRGIHCDETFESKDERFMVLLGRCTASISFDRYSVGEIYVRHDSVSEIAVSDHAFVILDLYDHAHVKVIASDKAKIVIKRHGKDCFLDLITNDDAVTKIKTSEN